MIKINKFESYPVEELLCVRQSDRVFIIETDCSITSRDTSIMFNNITSVTMMECGMLKITIDRWSNMEHKEVYRMFNKATNHRKPLEIELPEKLVVIRSARIDAFNTWKNRRKSSNHA